MKKRNLVLLAIVSVAAIAAIVWAMQPRAIAVETVQARRGLFEQFVADDGKTRVRDRYVVSAPLAGRLERIVLRAGDRVARGDAIGRLAPAAPAFLDVRTEGELRERVGAAEAQQRRAAADTRRAEAQRDQARDDLARQTRLAQSGFVSATAREQAQLALVVAERALESTRFAQEAAGHDLAQARAALSRYREGGPSVTWPVTAPVSGAVLKVMQESEAVVAIGTPLVEIGDPRALEAVVDVLSQEATAIRPGMPAKIEIASGTSPLAGRVRLIEPAAFTKVSALGVEEQRVNVVLDFAEGLESLPTLGDGYRVDAQIVTYWVENAVLVPVGALFRQGDGWAVFVVRDARASRRPVKLGARNPSEAWIEQGVSDGERVVVYPPEALDDGSRVSVMPARR